MPDNFIFEEGFEPTKRSMDALLSVCQKFGLLGAPCIPRNATAAEVQTLMVEEFPEKGLEAGFG